MKQKLKKAGVMVCVGLCVAGLPYFAYACGPCGTADTVTVGGTTYTGCDAGLPECKDTDSSSCDYSGNIVHINCSGGTGVTALQCATFGSNCGG